MMTTHNRNTEGAPVRPRPGTSTLSRAPPGPRGCSCSCSGRGCRSVVDDPAISRTPQRGTCGTIHLLGVSEKISVRVLLMAIGWCGVGLGCATETNREDDESGDQRSIACGSVTCVGEEVCCPGAESCTLDVSDCLNPDNGHGFYMTCDGPEDCSSGEVCCISVGIAAYGGTACVPMGDCDYSMFSTQYACHGGGDCPADMTCQPAEVADVFVSTLLGCK